MSTRRLVELAIEHHGPMCDAQLAWWMKRFGVKAAAARRARFALVKAGRVRFARRFARGETGRWGMMWEAGVERGA